MQPGDQVRYRGVLHEVESATSWGFVRLVGLTTIVHETDLILVSRATPRANAERQPPWWARNR